MDFLYANSELFIIGSIVLVVLASVMFLKPFLQKKGYLKADTLSDAQVILSVAKLVVSEIHFNSEKNKSRVMIMLESIDLAIAHIKGLMVTEDKDKLSQLSYDTVLESLTKLGIEVNEDESKAIKVAIEIGIDKIKIEQ